MNIQNIRKLLTNNDATVGSWLQIPSPDCAELLAQAGYDWIACDLEHGSFGPSILPNIFRAIKVGGAVPFARLPLAEKTWIKAALEAGAEGLIFPMIESAEQLSKAIDLATYPGQDTWRKKGECAKEYRGVGYCRANVFGKCFDAYRESIAPNIFICAQIEHIRALQELDQILSHPRLDAIMVGPYDLSGSMGLTAQFDHPQFVEALETIQKACNAHHVPMGIHIVQPDPNELKRQIAKGVRFIAYGIDTVFLWKSAERPR